jgi:hypothetical protein
MVLTTLAAMDVATTTITLAARPDRNMNFFIT